VEGVGEAPGTAAHRPLGELAPRARIGSAQTHKTQFSMLQRGNNFPRPPAAFRLTGAPIHPIIFE